jgi:UDP-GlcNAc3NAcA epimerase
MPYNPIKIATVVGARPQIIKASAVSPVLRTAGAEEILIHTGQHYDTNMSELFFEELSLPTPDYNLAVGSGAHGWQTAQMLQELERVLSGIRPDWVLLYGDTNSTLAGALAAAKLRIPIAHVEAGLRSFNRNMPEEINRVLTDHVSDMLFAPTQIAVDNLAREGLSGSTVILSGDVMYDIATEYASRAEARNDILNRFGLTDRGYALATIHRPENTDDRGRLRIIIESLAQFSTELPVILPLHPRTRNALASAGMLEDVSRAIRVLDPLGYLDMLVLEKHSRFVVTDSGGVQKEAFFFGVPCVTLRSETEWLELVELGCNVVVTPVSATVVLAALRGGLRRAPFASNGLYGDGHSAEHIAEVLLGVTSVRRNRGR